MSFFSQTKIRKARRKSHVPTQLDEQQRAQLQEFHLKYADLLPGRTNLIEHKIDVKPISCLYTTI